MCLIRKKSSMPIYRPRQRRCRDARKRITCMRRPLTRGSVSYKKNVKIQLAIKEAASAESTLSTLRADAPLGSVSACAARVAWGPDWQALAVG